MVPECFRQSVRFASQLPEWIMGIPIGLGEIARLGFRESVKGFLDLSNPDTAQYFLIHNTGDFSGSYFIALFTHAIISNNGITERMPEKLRMGISLAVACGVTAGAETFMPQVWHGDQRDIPMGIAGAVFYLTTNVLGNKFRGHHLYEYPRATEATVTGSRSLKLPPL